MKYLINLQTTKTLKIRKANLHKMDAAAQNRNTTEWSLEDEFEKNPSLNRNDCEILRNFCESLPSSASYNISDELVAAILHSNDYNLERARNVAARYFQLRANSPEVFENRQVDGDDLQSGLDVLYFCPLPRKSPEGYRVILQKMRRSEISAFNHVAASKFQWLTIDSIIHEDPTCPGYIFVGDMRGISMGHIFKASLFLARKLMRYVQEAIPMKIQQIIIINAGSLTDKMSRWMKPFVTKSMWDIIKFYSTSQMEEFWAIFPKASMPEEYGGDLPDLETLRQDQIRWLRRLQPVVDLRSAQAHS